MMDDSAGTPALSSRAVGLFGNLQMHYQTLLDKSTPHPGARWGLTGGLLFMFLLRIVLAQGWYIICYALGIYMLNLFLAFLTPKIDPEMAEELDEAEAASESGPGLLPVKNDDEFRPFIRRLPEFKFWLNSTKAVLLSCVCSFFAVFDIPVYWPILLFYWMFLFVITMRRQIEHMIKHRYVPFANFGKQRYSRGK
ncbi:hypothetical protein GGI03_004282 [Coemansia sp. RSA 2337]|nr:hypothetical protein GGI14_002271 [Coemansia sp. S680]KAJ2039690.1 hypothetical protein H4S03_001531 [Coemansia sp. S3946]KAJ2044483.1 hypothetical protein H4S04_006188 [Coemansia sp. S16]KAJ2047880.1 hypothetical protein GGI08_006150 [Coemansia sp. S2]KAJ2099022.1 hypothetical protein GGI09_003006 [Coemansia sp. S100]KAJ2114979.1 hypothetical protein IW146_002663 [Coemansia sp. RSA 922]KAJ2462743.1 hypothetical protein GGI03_004282 [Coemansia sp. RSA 2337]